MEFKSKKSKNENNRWRKMKKKEGKKAGKKTSKPNTSEKGKQRVGKETVIGET